MNFINGYKINSKQSDKYQFSIRIGKFTLVEISIDVSKKEKRFGIFNLIWETDKKRKKR